MYRFSFISLLLLSQLAFGQFWQIFSKGERIFYTRNNGMAYEIKPVSRNRFYATDWDVWFEFADKKEGGYQTFYLDWNGVKYPFPRMKKTAMP